MTTYVLRNGELVEKDKADPLRIVQIMPDTRPYKSPLGNGWITSRSHRREELKANNCREVDPSEYKPAYQNPRFAAKHGLPYTPGNEQHYRPQEREAANYDLSNLKR